MENKERLSLRVDNGVRRIEVNDAGEYITLNINDISLIERFSQMVEDLKAKLPELSEFDKALAEKYMNAVSQEDKIKRTIEYGKKLQETYQYIADKIDNVFGADTCRKVFGEGVVPNDIMIADFIDQMIPILYNMKAERDKKIMERYARRTGGNV